MSKRIAVLMVACCLSLGMRAQTAVKTATMVEPSVSFDASLKTLEDEMMSLAKAMPAEKYGFAPSAAIFVPSEKTSYEGVRSFGAMLAHVAQANFYYAGASSGLKPEVDMKSIGALTDKDKVVAALADSFAFSHKAMGTLTAANAFEGVRGMQTRTSLAAGLIAHGFDHYGQLVEYARMNGIVPPASAK